MEQGNGLRREPQGSTIPTPRFAKEIFNLGIASREIARLDGLSVLEGQFQDRSMR